MENEEKVYEVVRNKTKNMKVVISPLNGMEIAPGQTVNLKAMYRRAQLLDATSEIYHFIQQGMLEEVSSTLPLPEEQKSAEPMPGKMPEEVKEKIQKGIQDAKTRDLILELSDCTLISRLEDILLSPDAKEEVKKAAKLRYMTLRGWVDDDGKIIEGSADDEMQDIASVEAWEFKPLNTSKISGS
jgi:hypothetical protein